MGKEAKPVYAVVNPSGNVEGLEIKLGDVLKHLKPFKLRAPFAWIVGGLAVHGKTKGDIDVLVRAREGELSPEMWKALTFRIQRALPPELAERVQFHTDDLSGPITDNVPLYDLEVTEAERAVVRMDFPLACQDFLDGKHGGTEAEMAEVRAELVKAVQPAKFFKPMKPTLAAEPYERLTLDSLKRTLREKGTFPALVQKKLDGLSAILWKQGKRVGAYSDDGKDLSNSLALADILLKLREHKRASLVLVGELEAWRGDMHLPRDVLTGIVHSKTGAPEGVDITATFHDALYVDGDDLSDKPTTDRFAVLSKLGGLDKGGMGIVQSDEAADADEAVKLARKMGGLKGSEGALVKAAESAYKTGTEAADWFKWRHNAVVTALVVEPVETKVKGVYNYHFGFKPPPKAGEVLPGLTRRVNGEAVVYSGKTFSTDRKYGKGDLIAIEATTVNSYPKTGQVTLWLPRVLDDKYRAEKAHTTSQVIAAAKREPHVLVVRGERPIDAVTFEKAENPRLYLDMGGYVRPLGADGLVKIAGFVSVEYEVAKEKQPADPFMRYPDEGKTWRYSVGEHWRGRSVHADLRMELEKGETFVGWTLNTQVKGAVKEPVTTKAAAEAWAAKGGHSKIDWKTGEWAKRKRGKAFVNVEVVSERKGLGTFAWIGFEGVVKPGDVGATKEFPGVFNLVDRGAVQFGAQKPWVHEYFFNSSGKGGLSGRYIFRQLRAEALQRRKQFVVPPAAEAEFREEAAWFFIKAVDQTPYVLSNRAVSDAWLPPKGVSALPRDVRKRVPLDLRYWETSGKEALERRRELRKLFLKEDIVKAAAPEKVPFVLQWHGFRKRGEKPVRAGVTHQHYDVRFDFNEPTLRHWVLSESPLEHDETVGYFKRGPQKEAMEAEGEFEPGDKLGLNPTKESRAFVKILDKGSAKVFVDDMDGGVLKVRFAGKRLKGMWLFERRDAAEWHVRKVAEAPKKS